MTNIVRKIALSTTIALFCVLIGLNAYVASRNIQRIQGGAAQRAAASDFRSHIVAVKLDLQALETGQQGYLLTGDEAYLAPYTHAVEKLPKDFATMRSLLATRPAGERSLEDDVEQATQAKIAEADETIRLRRKDLRHRAFLIVASNHGKELMDHAYSLLDRLADMQTRNIAHYDRQLKSGIAAAVEQSVLGSGILLALIVVMLFAFDQSSKRLAHAYAKQSAQLSATRERLERFTSTVSADVRTTLADMTSQTELLLNADGGFLPRTGHERAQWIHQATCYLTHVLDNVLEHPSAGNRAERSTQTGGPYAIESTAAEHRASRTA